MTKAGHKEEMTTADKLKWLSDAANDVVDRKPGAVFAVKVRLIALGARDMEGGRPTSSQPEIMDCEPTS